MSEREYWIGRCPECGRVLYGAVTDMPPKEMAKEVAAQIRAGLNMNRTTVNPPGEEWFHVAGCTFGEKRKKKRAKA